MIIESLSQSLPVFHSQIRLPPAKIWRQERQPCGSHHLTSGQEHLYLELKILARAVLTTSLYLNLTVLLQIQPCRTKQNSKHRWKAWSKAVKFSTKPLWDPSVPLYPQKMDSAFTNYLYGGPAMVKADQQIAKLPSNIPIPRALKIGRTLLNILATSYQHADETVMAQSQRHMS